jgi:hypothetical protein
MAEDNTTQDQPVSVFSEDNPYKIIDYTKDELQFVYDRHGGESEEALAKATASIINKMPQYQGMADYTDLVQGRAPILDMVPLPPDARGSALTDDQILRLFTSLKGTGDEGVPTETDMFLKGLSRGTLSLAGGFAGAKTAATVAPPYVPLPGPAAPLGVLSKPVSGLGGFIVGSGVTDLFVGKPAADALFGDLVDIPLTPKTEAYLRNFESAGSVAPFIASPWLAPRAAFSTIDSLRKLPVANQVTVLSADDMANPLVTRYLSGKISGMPTNRQFTFLRDQIFRQSKEAGEDITLKEAGKLAAQQLNRPGKFTRGAIATVDFAEKALVGGGQAFRSLTPLQKSGVVAVETTAVPATFGAVDIAQDMYGPRAEGPRLGAEVIGSLAPSVSLLKLAPKIYGSTVSYLSRLRENQILKKPIDVFGTRAKAQNRAREDLFQAFEDNREDPDALLKALEEKLVDPVYKDGKIVGYKMKPEFQPKTGETKTPIFSGQFLDDEFMALNRLEQLVLDRGGPTLGTDRDLNFIKSMEMQRGTVFALRGTGDPELVRLAGQMMQDRIGMLINMRMEKAVNQTIAAVQKIYPEGGAEASRILGQRLNGVIKNQQQLFRRLEKNAWSSIDPNQTFTKFYRVDEETGEFVENAVPNFIEEWDATINGLDDLGKSSLIADPAMTRINEQIVNLKKQLGLDATDTLGPSTLPAVAKFDEAFQGSMGTGGRDSFLRILDQAGLTGPINSRVDDLLGSVSQNARNQYQTRLTSGGLNMNNADEVRSAAQTADEIAENYRNIAAQDPGGEQGKRLLADAQNSQDDATLLRAHADDLENPQTGTVGLNDIEPTEANIKALGDLEQRYGGRKNRNSPVANLIRLKRQALIAQLSSEQGAAATGVAVEPITNRNLTTLYSEARALARSKDASPNIARIANQLAEAVLEDLGNGPVGNRAFDSARDISYAYNQFLKRAFGGDILAKNARGKDIIDESLLVNKLMSGTPDATALKINQIHKLGDEIKRYAKQTGFEVVSAEEVKGAITSTDQVLLDALKLTLRDIEAPIEARALVRTPESVAVAQQQAMEQFRAKNPQIFEVFPELGQMMDEAGDAATFLQRVKGTAKRLEKRVNEQKAFAKLIDAENPERAVLHALQSDNPVKELDGLLRVLKASTKAENLKNINKRSYRSATTGIPQYARAIPLDEALAGARHVFLGLAFSKGGKFSQTDFNAKGAYDMLFDPIPNAARGTPTLSDIMLKNNIMSEREMNSLRTGLTRIIKSETKQDVSQAIIRNETPALLDMYTRILGSRIGTGVGQMLPGGRATGAGLIEAEAGSRYLRQLTQEIPALQEYDALEAILLDPELLALSLRTPRSPSEKAGIVNAIVDKLGTIGVAIPLPVGTRAIPLGVQEFNEEEGGGDQPLPGTIRATVPQTLQQRTDDVKQRADELINQQSSLQVPVPAQPVAQPTTTLASAPPPPAPSGPVDRARFAALFPEDRDLIQGIGSLMG